jgi:hypothetical protein
MGEYFAWCHNCVVQSTYRSFGLADLEKRDSCIMELQPLYMGFLLVRGNYGASIGFFARDGLIY